MVKCAQDQLSTVTSILILLKSKTVSGPWYTLTRSVPRTPPPDLGLLISNVLSSKRHDRRKHDVQLLVVTYPGSLRATSLILECIGHRHPSRLKAWTPTENGGRATPEAHHSTIAVLMPTLPRDTLLLMPIKPILSQVPYPEASSKWSLMASPHSRHLQLDPRPLISHTDIMECQATK